MQPQFVMLFPLISVVHICYSQQALCARGGVRMTQSFEASLLGLLYKIELLPTNQSQETITVMHEELLVVYV